MSGCPAPNPPARSRRAGGAVVDIDDVGQPDPHRRLQVQLAGCRTPSTPRRRSRTHGRRRRRRPAVGQVVETDDHVLRRHRDGLAIGRLQDVVRRQHEDACLGLRLRGQRHVHGHLVTVEVGVERRTHERVDLDGLALDELRLERLDAEAVQGRCAVQQHRVLADDLFEHVPHDRALTLDHALGRLDVLRVVQVHQALHHERLEQLQRHLLGQAALVQLEPRADDDDGTTGVVDALAEQVLAEPALLALEHVGQRLERPVARTGHGTPAAAVVEQSVDGLLQHPLLVVDDDLRRTEVDQPLEAVVPIDHPAVEVVQIGGGEAATVELNHRAQVRRDDRHAVEHHAERRVVRVQERRDDLEALERTDLPLALAGPDRLPQALGLGVEIHVLDQRLDGLGAHAAGEVLTEPVTQLAVEQLVGDELLRSSLRNVSMTSSRRSISRCARSRICRISRSPPSLTFRRTSALAPSASSSARSASSLAPASRSRCRERSRRDASRRRSRTPPWTCPGGGPRCRRS